MTHNYRILLHYYYFLCTFSVQNRTAVELTVKPLCAILANLSVHFLCYLFMLCYLFIWLFIYVFLYLFFFFYVTVFIGKYILTYLLKCVAIRNTVSMEMSTVFQNNQLLTI